MKRVLFAALGAAIILAACSGAPKPSETVKPGSYTAVCRGYYGDFPVTVTLDSQAIKSVTTGAYKETEALGGKAIKILSERIVAANTAGVDSVSGATVTSAAFKKAVRDCLAKAGADGSMTARTKETKRHDKGYASDVLVIGAGAAGLSAAVTAAEGGASVTLIEKQDIIGGSTATSAGIVYAATDPKDYAPLVDYYMARAEGKADRARLQFFAEHSLDTVKFLEGIGVQWLMTVPAGTAPEPRARFSKYPDGTAMIGSALTDPLEKRAKELGVAILTGVRATSLIKGADGRITGAKAISKTEDLSFKAKAVVLATGGFDASEELKAKYSPIAVGDLPLSSKGNTGDGIAMGIAAGAATEFFGGVIGFEFVNPVLPNSGYSGIAMGSSGFVKADGSFIAARSDYPINYTALKNAGGKSFFGLYAGDKAEAAVQPAIDKNLGYKAATIAQLAAATGMSEDKLADSFGKLSLSAGPYFAVQVRATTIGSMGGIKTNMAAEALSSDGSPIPGLYAAGEVANGGFYYKEYPASGSSISLAITYGREAGKNAAAFVKTLR